MVAIREGLAGKFSLGALLSLAILAMCCAPTAAPATSTTTSVSVSLGVHHSGLQFLDLKGA
jgi:hypothetical protein